MALVRILVDGYGLLQSWPAAAPGKPRHSEGAREELINHLTQYFDAAGTPLTIVFDGELSPFDPAVHPSTHDVEVVFTRHGQTPGQLMERLAHKLSSQGEYLVATDDESATKKVASLGGLTSRCNQFIQLVEQTHADLEREIEELNQKENQKFTQHG